MKLTAFLTVYNVELQTKKCYFLFFYLIDKLSINTNWWGRKPSENDRDTILKAFEHRFLEFHWKMLLLLLMDSFVESQLQFYEKNLEFSRLL